MVEFDMSRRDMTDDPMAEEKLLLKIIGWAQNKKKKISELTEAEVREAITEKS